MYAEFSAIEALPECDASSLWFTGFAATGAAACCLQALKPWHLQLSHVPLVFH